MVVHIVSHWTVAQLKYLIEPHIGIGPISLGMIRDEVVAAMEQCGGGPPVPRGSETECFFENAFQVSFDGTDKADFIEICSGIPGEVLFGDRDVFDMHADELLALIRNYEEPDHKLSEPPDSYVFSGLILTLWGRDEQYDYKGGEQRPVFATVGIGAPSYLVAIREIGKG